MEKSIILASASPRRKELLKLIFNDFVVLPSDAEEIVPAGTDVLKVPEFLAKLKALSIANTHKESLVIGCDTAVIIGNEILGKPKSKSDAFSMIKKLSGKTHFVVSGCAIVKNGNLKLFSEKTEVTFFELSDSQIKNYIETDEPYDKAGGYGIQGKASLFVEKINGDYFNVVGLPVARLNKEINGT